MGEMMEVMVHPLSVYVRTWLSRFAWKVDVKVRARPTRRETRDGA
jgi:hypothetical protein